eukprot:663629-Prorocentrum_minimum.AAC.3
MKSKSFQVAMHNASECIHLIHLDLKIHHHRATAVHRGPEAGRCTLHMLATCKPRTPGVDGQKGLRLQFNSR